MNKEKEKGKGILPGIILVSFVAAVATFFIMLQVEKNALSAYEKELVWCTNAELPKGLEITEQNKAQYFVQVELDKSKVPSQLVVDPADLVGTQTAILVPQGAVLCKTMFSDEERYVETLHSPVVAGCKAEDLFQLVSGVLRKGDLVHIYTVNEELGATYLLWENVLVYQVFDSAGNAIASEDVSTPAARVNLLLEKGYAEQFYNELQNGSLRVVKVWE